jgi:hypothetical protein
MNSVYQTTLSALAMRLKSLGFEYTEEYGIYEFEYTRELGEALDDIKEE